MQKTNIKERVKKEIARDVKACKNAPIKAFDHLLGEAHTVGHKMVTGVAFIMVGVSVSIFVGEMGGHHVKFICDGVGYFIHGIGCAPFLEYFTKIVNRK